MNKSVSKDFEVIKRIFPSLASRKKNIAMVCIQDEMSSYFSPTTHRDWKRLCPIKDSQKVIEHLSMATHSLIQYGDYLADRTLLWQSIPYVRKILRNTPVSTATLHLGVDITAPAGTMVHTPINGKVIFVEHDKFQKGGWGGRIVIEPPQGKYVFIFGHLNNRGLPSLGTILHRGDPITPLGRSTINGGWWPHLHLQAVLKSIWLKHGGSLDGYVFVSPSTATINKIKKTYPEPLKTIARSMND